MRSRAVAVLFTALVTAYAWLLLRAESQGAIAALILVGIAAGILAMRTQLLRPVVRSLGSNERFAQGLAFAAVIVIALALREDDFALLLLTRVLIVIVACLGLNVQFGYAGVVNFAGASFFSSGGAAFSATASRDPSGSGGASTLAGGSEGVGSALAVGIGACSPRDRSADGSRARDAHRGGRYQRARGIAW